LPVFASNWCLRSARVSASSWMSISSNKSSHTKLEGVCSQQRLRQHLGWTFDTRVCGACDARRERMGRVRSARCNIFYSLAGERFSGVRRMRRRQHLGWTFRLGTRWASEGARRRAGTHPWAAGPRASAAPEAKGGAELFCLGVSRAAAGLSRQSSVRGARCRGKIGPDRPRCVPSFHTRCLKSGPLIAVTKNLMCK